MTSPDPHGSAVVLLDGWAASTPGVDHALIVTSDGLLFAASTGMARETAERVAAASIGMLSMSDAAGEVLQAGGCNQVMAMFELGRLLLTGISATSSLGVVTDAAADLGLVGYQMNHLVAGIGRVLSPQTRAEAAPGWEGA